MSATGTLDNQSLSGSLASRSVSKPDINLFQRVDLLSTEL